MRRAFALSVLCLLLAPAAFAAGPSAAASEPAVETPAPDDSEAVPAPGAEADLEAFFDEIGDGTEAERRYACPIDAPGECTSNIDCHRWGIPASCGGERLCNNPSGYVCHGWCYCG